MSGPLVVVALAEVLAPVRAAGLLAQRGGVPVDFYSLTELPPAIFEPGAYAQKPAAFVDVQRRVLEQDLRAGAFGGLRPIAGVDGPLPVSSASHGLPRTSRATPSRPPRIHETSKRYGLDVMHGGSESGRGGSP